MGYVMIVGSPWILREGIKQTLKRLGLAIVGEGERFAEARAGYDGVNPPTLMLFVVGQIDGHPATLGELKLAGEAFREAKRVVLAGQIDEADKADIAALVETGIDALLPAKLSSQMLASSFQLVLLNQRLFPNSSMPKAGAIIDLASSCADKTIPSPTEPAAPPGITGLDVGPPTPQIVRLRDHVHSLPLTGTADPVWVRPRPTAVRRERLPVLSDREWQILHCLARGSSNKFIARELGIAETTVKVHVKSLLRKLGVENRTQAAIWSIKQSGTETDYSAGTAGTKTYTPG